VGVGLGGIGDVADDVGEVAAEGGVAEAELAGQGEDREALSGLGGPLSQPGQGRTDAGFGRKVGAAVHTDRKCSGEEGADLLLALDESVLHQRRQGRARRRPPLWSAWFPCQRSASGSAPAAMAANASSLVTGIQNSRWRGVPAGRARVRDREARGRPATS